MQKDLINKFPKWTQNLEEIKNFMILSDDLDSLFSCAILNKLFEIKIGGFYNFYELYITEDKSIRDGKPIGVDTDFTRLKCFGNHVTSNNNKNCANLNNIYNIGTNNYIDKFAGSTLLTILSLYNMHNWVKNLNEEAQMVLLCVDSSFLGYFYNGNIHNTHKKWFQRLGFENLYNLIKTKTQNDFEKINKKYNLKGKIAFDNTTEILNTNINIVELEKLFNLNLRVNLTNLKFKKVRDYKTVHTIYTENLKDNKDIISLARTSKYKCKYTIKY